MIRFLTYASVTYAVILVLALAAVLVTIWMLLMQINAVLRRVRAKLGDVAEWTRPLEKQLSAVTTAAVTGSDEVSRGVAAFVAARERRTATPGERRR